MINYAVVGAGWISQQAFLPGVVQSGNSRVAAIVTGDERIAWVGPAAELPQRCPWVLASGTDHRYLHELTGTDERNVANLGLLLGVRTPERANGSRTRAAGALHQ